MSDVKSFLLAAVVALFIITGVVRLKVYRYGECKKVGHSTFYCVTSQ